MEPIFREQKNQSLFEKNGFVKLALLNEAQVDELVAFFNRTRERHATVADLHHTTTDTKDEALILEVDAQIKSVFVPALENVLLDFKPLAATFHIKEPGPGSATGIHQDPTFVDETRYCSANVWVALHDIDAHNGNLYFISGSNHAVKSLRTIPSFPGYYDSFRERLPEMRVQVPLKKGEAVIFSNATIHGATENNTDSMRLAATLLVCSRPADWLLYYRDEQRPDGLLEKYHLDLQSFMTMAKGEKPARETFREAVPYEFPQLTHGDFVRRVKGGRPGYLQRIRNALRGKRTV